MFSISNCIDGVLLPSDIVCTLPRELNQVRAPCPLQNATCYLQITQGRYFFNRDLDLVLNKGSKIVALSGPLGSVVRFEASFHIPKKVIHRNSASSAVRQKAPLSSLTIGKGAKPWPRCFVRSSAPKRAFGSLGQTDIDPRCFDI